MAYARPTLFERFLAWWWPSILAWFPARFAQWIDFRKPLRFLHWDGVGLHDDALAKAGKCAGVVVVLPRKLVLVRQFRTPISTPRQLRATAHALIERLTPFQQDDVHFAVVSHPHNTEKTNAFIDADLVVVPRRTLAAVMDAARNSTLQPLAIDVAGANQAPLGLDLLPDSARDGTESQWRRWNLALAVVCLLALAGISFGLLNARQRAVTELEMRFQPLRTQAVDTQRRERALRQLESMLRADTEFTHSTALELLSELSARLPTECRLTYFNLEGGSLAIRGETINLAGTLARLGQSSRWNFPKLTGSRTLPDGRSQAFSMTLALRQASPKGRR